MCWLERRQVGQVVSPDTRHRLQWSARRVVRIAAAMAATVNAARVARIASTQSNDLISMIYVHPLPNRLMKTYKYQLISKNQLLSVI
jgi:hypothetical protein